MVSGDKLHSFCHSTFSFAEYLKSLYYCFSFFCTRWCFILSRWRFQPPNFSNSSAAPEDENDILIRKINKEYFLCITLLTCNISIHQGMTLLINCHFQWCKIYFMISVIQDKTTYSNILFNHFIKIQNDK